MIPRDSAGPHDVTEVLADREAGARRRLVAMWSGGSIIRDLPESGVVDIGRGEEAAIRIDHSSISRRHARIHLGEEIAIEDLGSSNGTFVDGKKLPSGSTVPVRPGIVIELGAVMLVVRDSRAPATPAAGGTSDERPTDVVVCDPAMERIHQLIDLAARSALTVLLLGETGVGKEVLATRVHALSPRAGKPFLKVNCAALVESLLEAELFGYEKGAFTGAVQAKVGLLEGANGGTLFLDEVGELPPVTQAKLLRVLESGEVTRIGGLKPRPLDVRFVAATNRNLKDDIGRGRFRQDLFFRLDGISIRIPPLRERPSEVGALARLFAAQACAASNRPPVTLSNATQTALIRHSWPGNARELRNVMARAVLLTPSDTIEPEQLHFDSIGSVPPPAAAPSLDAPPEVAKAISGAPDPQHVLAVLEQCVGNQTRAAKMLGVSRSTLVRWLDQIGAPRPRK